MQPKHFSRRPATHHDDPETNSRSNTGSAARLHTGHNTVTAGRTVPADPDGNKDKLHTGSPVQKTTNAIADMHNDLEPVYGKQKHTQAGQPTLYTPEVCDKVIEWGKQGYSKTNMASELCVSRTTIYEWCKDHVEFSYALSIAMTHSESYWEHKALKGIDEPAKEFNTGLFGKIMSARFPETYRETTRTEHGGIGGGPIPVAVATVQITGEGLRDYYKQFVDKATRPRLNASSIQD